MISWADSIVGSASPTIRLAGPPASTTASWSTWAVRLLQRLAPGWALKTTAFPAEIMAMALQMTVAVGLVLGTIAPMTPYGAYSTRVMPPSPVHAVGVSISVPAVLLALSRFLVTLSS